MLRILQLNAPTSLAGAERVLLNFMQHYDTSKYSVRVVSYLNHRRLNNSFTAALDEKGISYDTIVVGNTSSYQQIKQTIDAIRRHSADILHTHGYCSDFIGLLAARFSGIPVISTVHGWTPVSFKLRGYQMLDRFCLKYFDTIVCVSSLLREELLRHGISSERLVHLPNSVSIPEPLDGQASALRQQLKCMLGEKIIVSIGRLSPEKGLDILLTSYASQFGSRRDVRLILVGDGPQKEALAALARRLNIAEQVIFAGFVSNVSSYYAAADLFVMPSHTEGFPMALLEAMAAGLPVIATAVGGIPDIIQDGIDGCLVPPGDIDRLGASMAKMIMIPNLAQQMGNAARITVNQRFSVVKWARTLETIYSGVYERRARNGYNE